MQKKSLTKLLRLSYSIQYWKEVENKAADALSRIHKVERSKLGAITIRQPLWMQELSRSYKGDEVAQQCIITSLNS